MMDKSQIYSIHKRKALKKIKYRIWTFMGYNIAFAIHHDISFSFLENEW